MQLKTWGVFGKQKKGAQAALLLAIFAWFGH